MVVCRKSGGILVYICPSFHLSVPSVRPLFGENFSSKISQKPCKLACSYLVCRLMTICCIVGLRTSLLLLICPFICPIFFPSILWWNFLSKISQQPCKVECSYLVYRLMMICCIVGLRTSLLLLILPCICPIFFPSILWRMTFFVKDFSRTMQAWMLIFGMHVDDDLLYRGIGNQPSPAYSFVYLSNFLSINTFKNEIFRQRVLKNLSS